MEALAVSQPARRLLKHRKQRLQSCQHDGLDLAPTIDRPSASSAPNSPDAKPVARPTSETTSCRNRKGGRRSSSGVSLGRPEGSRGARAATVPSQPCPTAEVITSLFASATWTVIGCTRLARAKDNNHGMPHQLRPANSLNWTLTRARRQAGRSRTAAARVCSAWPCGIAFSLPLSCPLPVSCSSASPLFSVEPVITTFGTGTQRMAFSFGQMPGASVRRCAACSRKGLPASPNPSQLFCY